MLKSFFYEILVDLLIVFGFNGPRIHYFSPYRAVAKVKGETATHNLHSLVRCPMS